MEPVFDEPQWVFQIPPEGTEDSMALGIIECFSMEEVNAESEFRGKTNVVLPSELFKFAKDVLKLAEFKDLFLYLEQVNERWYLIVEVPDSDEQDLWYYTKSNLPEWARRVYGI